MAKVWMIICSHTVFVILFNAALLFANEQQLNTSKLLYPQLRAKNDYLLNFLRDDPLAPSNPETVSNDATETNTPATSFDEVSPYTTAATEHIKKKCNCSRVYDPVCASNQKSYYNPCRMKCEDPNLFILYLGNCLPF